jgi:glc operon protein GlcG
VSGVLVMPTKTIGLAGAEQAIAAARAEAIGRGLAVTIAVLDRGGQLVMLQRMDGIHIGTVEVAQLKAQTAARFARPTAELSAALAGGNTALLSLPGVLPFPGGQPLRVEGAIVGAIGVSGAAPEVDEAIALVGAAAFESGVTRP